MPSVMSITKFVPDTTDRHRIGYLQVLAGASLFAVNAGVSKVALERRHRARSTHRAALRRRGARAAGADRRRPTRGVFVSRSATSPA